MAKKSAGPPKEHLKAVEAAWTMLRQHPLFGGLTWLAFGPLSAQAPLPKDAYARIVVSPQRNYYPPKGRPQLDQRYDIECNTKRRATPQEWANVFAQLLLHVAMNHTEEARTDRPWLMACELIATDLLRSL